MVCSRRFRISSRDRGGALDFLAFSNFDLTLDRGPITERVLFCIFPRISSITEELFLFFFFNRSYRLRREGFFWDIFFKLCVCLRCKLRREVPFKLIFLR